jgi:hypothetical protein
VRQPDGPDETIMKKLTNPEAGTTHQSSEVHLTKEDAQTWRARRDNKDYGKRHNQSPLRPSRITEHESRITDSRLDELVSTCSRFIGVRVHSWLHSRSIAVNRAYSRSLKASKKWAPHEICPCQRLSFSQLSSIHYQLLLRTGLTGLTGWEAQRTSDLIFCLDRLTSRRIFGLAEVEDEQVT